MSDDVEMIPIPDSTMIDLTANDISPAGQSAPSTSSQQPQRGKAWQKAQEALQKIQPLASLSQQDQMQQHPCLAFGVPDYIQNTMYQAYPWMSQYNLPYPDYWSGGGAANTFAQSQIRAPWMTPSSGMSPYPSSYNGASNSRRPLYRSPQKTPRLPVIRPFSNGISPRNPLSMTSPRPSPQGKSDQMPPKMIEYVHRAYAHATSTEEKDKVELVLKQKLQPLVESGAAWTVNWEAEPLPTDSNFKMCGDWTPASVVKQQKVHHLGGATPLAPTRQSLSFGIRGAKTGMRIGTLTKRPWQSGSRSRSTSPQVNKDSSSKVHQNLEPDRKVFSKKALRKQRKRERELRKQQLDDNSKQANSNMADQDSFIPLGAGAVQEKKKPKPALKFALSHQTKQQQELLKRKRAARFAEATKKRPTISAFSSVMKKPANDESDEENYWQDDEEYEIPPLIIGTCEDVEKSYFRLNTAPDPSQVRPQSVLEKSLSFVKQRYKDTGDYRYACDQLKSIRQDMTIQCIRNNFSVQVYETHARIAIEKGDKEEFNQCQNQLKMLYKELKNCPNWLEFAAYRLLFFVYTENNADITSMLAELDLDKQAQQDHCVSFALKVRLAWFLSDYHRLFRFYLKGPPRMCVYLMELFVGRERKKALKIMLKTYRPTLPLDFLSNQLGFANEQDCADFLKSCSVPTVEDPNGCKVDCRQCSELNF